MYANPNDHFAISVALFIGTVIFAVVIGAWLRNIPRGATPGIGNFVIRLYLNNVIGTGLKLFVDAIYALILEEECRWINGLEWILRRIF